MSAENLSIMLGNFFDNSARHCAAFVSVDAGVAAGFGEITVSDDGEGINPGNRDRVFDPFFTTRRETGGTGMGLSIVSAIAKAHGGEARVLPAGKGGAAFSVSLPAA